MLRNGGLGQRKMVDNFAANTGFSLHKETYNSHPSRMRQRSRELREFLSPFEFRHRQRLLPIAALRPA
jgi:hypothetical protein